MKGLFYILLLCCSWGFSQELVLTQNGGQDLINTHWIFADSENICENEVLLKKEDFTLTDGRMLVTAMECRIRNEDSTIPILVSVVCKENAFNKVGVEKINNMLLVANEKVRNSLNANHRYNPMVIKMAYIPGSNDWSLTSSFTVQDEDGLVIERLLAIEFDSNGAFAGMAIIL